MYSRFLPSCFSSTTGPISVPGFKRIVDDQPLHALDHRGDEAIVNAFGHDQPARRRAALTGLEVRAVDRHRHRRCQIRVVEDDERVLAAHLELHPRRRSSPPRRRPTPMSCDPVKLTASTSADEVSAGPIFEPGPITRLSTPGGNPAR